MSYRIEDAKMENVHNGFEIRPCKSAHVFFENGDWIGVSQYDNEDYWVCDSAFKANYFPIFCSGVGSRVTAFRTVADEEMLKMLDEMDFPTI